MNEDQEMALLMGKNLKTIDYLVFGKKAIKNIFVITGEILPNNEFFFYVADKEDKSGTGEHYEIFQRGLEEGIKLHQKEMRHLFLVKKIKGEWKNIIPLTQEEIILEIVIHEVRHRLQNNYTIELFSSVNMKEIPRLRHLSYLVGELLKIKKTRDHYKEEFDATVVEFISVGRYHQGKKIKDLVDIIRSEPKSIRKLI